MGLNYGFDIFCDRSKLWDFIDSVIVLNKPSPNCSTTITLGNEQKVVPLWLSDDHNTLSLDDAQNNDDGFCLALPFVPDDEINEYLKESMETDLRQNPNATPIEPRYDSTGRVLIGCIYFYIVADLDAINRTGYDTNLVCFEFRAATSRMSRMLEASQSVHKTFLELAKNHEAVYCLFTTGGQGQSKILWLESVLKESDKLCISHQAPRCESSCRSWPTTSKHG